MNTAVNEIDPKSLRLVRAFRAAGIATRASCQGHGFPINREPYVMFNTSERRAAILSKVLRDDAEHRSCQAETSRHVPRGFEWRQQGHPPTLRLITLDAALPP